MSKHDTFVKLKLGNPFKSVLHLFEDEWIPVRDPWGMCQGKRNGKTVSLFCIDKDRITKEQEDAIVQIYARNFRVSPSEILKEAEKDGITFSFEWVEAMTGETECYRRTLELADFLEAHPEPDEKTYSEFLKQQYRDWINGNRIPEPMPENYEDIDPRYKSPELEQAYKQRKINELLKKGNYSVFDVMSGTAAIEVLNQIDPDNEYSLISLDEYL